MSGGTRTQERGSVVDEMEADVGLIAACQQGDSRAFRRVFELYRSRVYALCRHMTGNPQDAEDLAQEVFIAAFRGIGSFRAESAFGTWLYRIAANRCTGELRRHRPRFEPADEGEAGKVLPLDPGPDPEEELACKEVVQRVAAAVDGLPDGQRLIYVLGTQMGMPYQRIAQIAGCSEEAVKVRMHRARCRVRDEVRASLGT
ncbi:MAG: sigma-70 family RNA polymerase sigma factor [Candidatus Latescibacterota bacterium]